MESYQSEIESNENNETLKMSTETLRSEPLPDQEKAVWHYIDMVEQRTFFSRKYLSLKEVILPQLKQQLTVDTISELRPQIEQKESEAAGLLERIEIWDRSVSKLYGQISEESKEKYLTAANVEALRALKIEQEEKEEAERASQWEVDHPVVPKERMPYAAEVEKFENEIKSFETKHSLEALHSIELTPELHNLFVKDRDMSAEQIESAIQNLSVEDAERYKIRTAAKKDLIPIVETLKVLEDRTDISKELFKETCEKYMKLSRAVGMINNGKLDHTR